MMNITNDKLCINCSEMGITFIHLFYFCKLGQNPILCLRSLLLKICKLKTKKLSEYFEILLY